MLQIFFYTNDSKYYTHNDNYTQPYTVLEEGNDKKSFIVSLILTILTERKMVDLPKKSERMMKTYYRYFLKVSISFEHYGYLFHLSLLLFNCFSLKDKNGSACTKRDKS